MKSELANLTCYERYLFSASGYKDSLALQYEGPYELPFLLGFLYIEANDLKFLL